MKRKHLMLLAIPLTATLCWSSSALAATVPSDDTVTSQKIKEADGTSGQSTNSGAGVKTGHIQNGAVTDAKIADVSMGKVTGLAAALTAKADQSATAIALADKADQSALTAGLTGKADLDHLHYYGNVTTVATSGAEYTDPAAAMNDVATWCGSPSAENPCLMKIMPGVYDIGAGTINMSSYVDIEGSGKNVTVLVKSAPATTNDCLINTSLAQNSEIRGLTVKRTGTGTGAIYGSGNTISLAGVAVSVAGTTSALALTNNYGNISLTDVTVDSSGRAISLTDNDKVKISNSRFTGFDAYAASYVQGRVNDSAAISGATFTNNYSGSFTRGLHLVFYPIPAPTNGNEFKVDMKDSSVYAGRLGLLAVNGVNLSMSDMDIKSDNVAIEYNGNGTALASIADSRISGNVYLGYSAIMEIANSQITGAFTGTTTPGAVKCFGVYDANLAGVVCP